MNINGKNLCPSCFTEMEREVCKACGYSSEMVDKYPIALPIGTILMGRYLIGKVLGKGGFGITYLAFDLNQNKKVAIKEYLPDNLTHRNTGKTEVSVYTDEKGEAFLVGANKFFEEAKTVSKFNGHPNIINVYEFFYENNTAYFVMEYLNGIDLKSYVINNGGKISEERTKEIILPIIDALIVIHSIGILHRDISPDNIYICDDGNVKILDFGAARQVLGQQSKSLSVVLKQGFAPIEQYQTRGKQGEWTDIYALGATMYYCLTGRVPESAMDRVYEDNLKSFKELDIHVSEQLSNIILKAIAVRETNRFQNIFEFKSAFMEDKISDVAPEDNKDSKNLLKAEENKVKKMKLFKNKRAGVYIAIAYIAVFVCIIVFVAFIKGQTNKNQSSSGGSNTPQVAINKEEQPMVKTEPVPTEPAKTEPTKTEPTKTEPTKTEPTKTEPAKTEPAKTKPVKTEPAKTEPAKTKPAKTEPVKTEPAKTEPAKTEPVKTEPAKTEPTKTEPVKTEPAKTEPTKTEPAKTEPPKPEITKVNGIDFTYRTSEFSVKCKYTGEWKDNLPNGSGELEMIENVSPYWQIGDKLKGNFINGLLEGAGTYTGINGGSYNGAFKNGLKNGYGVFIYSDGAKYEGYFKDGKFNGKGVYTDENGEVWDGNWVNGKFQS